MFVLYVFGTAAEDYARAFYEWVNDMLEQNTCLRPFSSDRASGETAYDNGELRGLRGR